jgi:hypothetical protein
VSLNASLAGKTYPSVSFTVEAAHVRRFAAAVGEDGSYVPPTFVTVPEIAAGLAQVLADRDLGLDLARVLHGEQAYEWVRPITVGETLEVRSTIESIRSKGGLELITLRTDMRDADGTPVVVGRSTLIVRGAA